MHLFSKRYITQRVPPSAINLFLIAALVSVLEITSGAWTTFCIPGFPNKNLLILFSGTLDNFLSSKKQKFSN